VTRIADVDPELLRFGLFLLVFAALFIAAGLLVATCSALVVGVAVLHRSIRSKEVPSWTDTATGSSPSFPQQRSTT